MSVCLVAIGIFYPSKNEHETTKSSDTVESSSYSSSSKAAENKTTAEQTTPEVNYSETSDPQQTSNISIETATRLFQQTFEEFGPVRYDASIKSFILTPTDPDLINGIKLTIDRTLNQDNWISMVNNLKIMSTSITSSLGPGYSFIMENPYSTGDMILSVSDGQITYDGVAEAAGFSY